MAYVSQDLKKRLAPGIKEVLKKYGMKWSISVNNHYTLVVSVSSGSIEFPPHSNINHYWIEESFKWIQKDFLLELTSAMMVWNWDNSDFQSDYYDKGWYIQINIGSYGDAYIHNPIKDE